MGELAQALLARRMGAGLHGGHSKDHWKEEALHVAAVAVSMLEQVGEGRCRTSDVLKLCGAAVESFEQSGEVHVRMEPQPQFKKKWSGPGANGWIFDDTRGGLAVPETWRVQGMFWPKLIAKRFSFTRR